MKKYWRVSNEEQEKSDIENQSGGGGHVVYFNWAVVGVKHQQQPQNLLYFKLHEIFERLEIFVVDGIVIELQSWFLVF